MAVGSPAARRRGLGTGGEDSGGANFRLFARLGGDAFAVVGVFSGLGSGRAVAFRFRDLGGGCTTAEVVADAEAAVDKESAASLAEERVTLEDMRIWS